MQPGTVSKSEQMLKTCEGLIDKLGIGDSCRPPKMLYHYTGAAGLEGILRTKTIWATHYNYLNDFSEGDVARIVARDLIKTRLAKLFPTNAFDFRSPQRSNDIPGMPRLGFYAHLPQDQWADVFVPLSVYDLIQEEIGDHFFVASFCEDDDLLSQWRGYANAGGGYSIGMQFTENAFKHGGNEFQIYKMLYDPAAQARLIEQVLDEAVAAVKSVPRNAEDELSKYFFLPEWHHISSTAANLINYISTRCKHKSFFDEKEWRLSARIMPDDSRDISTFKDDFPRKDQLSGVQFRFSNGLLVPYLAFPLEIDNIQINSIRCGPVLHRSLAGQSARMLATKYWTNEIPIKFSDVPFRN